jgi:hypothetical protein
MSLQAVVDYMRGGKLFSRIKINCEVCYKEIPASTLKSLARAFAQSMRAEIGDSVIVHIDMDKTYKSNAYLFGRDEITWSDWKKVKAN